MSILEVRQLSKKYKIRHESRPYLSLRDKLSDLLKPSRARHEDFMALDNVSFDVRPGDTIGFVGRNGAGKSTLLKVLSKITPPSSGSVISRGRIASLLEVGTGFHPELSGRENIFLNGSILGLRKKEIEKVFDAIIDFSGVERFIDTPLKNYSSGMQLRLAFAVAAMLEPEILIIDEVLAVGDAEFQKKCLSKMEDVSQGGRTILFVSHNLPAVKKLCKRGILLEQGKLVFDGPVQETIDLYTRQYEADLTEFSVRVNNADQLPGYAYSVKLEDLHGNPCNDFSVGSGWQVRILFKIRNRIPGFIIALGMMTADDVALRTSWSKAEDIDPGDYEVVFKEEKVMFGAGYYKLVVGLSSRMMSIQYVENCAYLRINEEIPLHLESVKYSSGVGLVLNPMEIKILPKS